MEMQPEIASKEPVVKELEAGTYFWCTCGRSKGQPFCDGKHSGTGFVPMRFEVEEKSTCALCNCKHTANKPFCDGSHAKL